MDNQHLFELINAASGMGAPYRAVVLLYERAERRILGSGGLAGHL